MVGLIQYFYSWGFCFVLPQQQGTGLSDLATYLSFFFFFFFAIQVFPPRIQGNSYFGFFLMMCQILLK